MARGVVAAFACAIACAAGCASGDGGRDEGTAGLGGSSGDRTETGEAATADDAGADTASSPPATGSDAGDTGPSAGCGDGVRGIDEQCDDGNLEDGDGCNSDCQMSGQLLWQHVGSAGFGLDDDANDVAVAPDGTIYMAGYSKDVEGSDDQWLRKLSAVGGMLWTDVHDGPAGAGDQLRGVVVDALGSIYVVGYQSVTGQSANIFVRKYDEYGDPQWTDTFDNGEGGHDAVADVIVDAAGDLVVVGHVQTATEARDVWFRKYDTEGNVQWTRTWSGPAGLNDQGWDVASTADGDYYVVGQTTTDAEGTNTFVAKLDVDGNVLWTRSHNGEAGLDDRLRGVAADDTGVVVCGYEDHDAYPWQSFIRKYDPQGAIEWTIVDPGGSMEGAHCFGIERADNGDWVWTGGENFNQERHAVLGRIDPQGNERWRTVLPVMADGPDFGRDLDFTADGTIIVGGRIDAGVDGNDAWAAAFTP